MNAKNLIYCLLLVYAIACTFTIVFLDGTADNADSITHYLFARYAPSHPRLYFDHWAKPLFVLLASPFAQMGFNGIKIFNVIVSLATIFFTYRTAVRLNIRNAIVAAVMMIFSPFFYVLTFSGLTEPLFALTVILGIYLCVGQRYLAACLVISFLPYVRSEGLIIIGVFGIYLLQKKLWKLLPCLLAGSFVYAIAGYFVYHDLLWVFTKIPYATLNSVYGSGRLFHFVEQLIFIVGVPIYALFWTGFIRICIHSLKRKTGAEMRILVLLGFCAFFIAHTLFWYLGIFNSMGLKRVLVGILPLIALIALEGFNFIKEDLAQGRTLKMALAGAVIAYVILFPFTPNPSAINWEKDMMLDKDQELAMDVAALVKKEIQPGHPVIFDHPYLSLVLDMDYYAPAQTRRLARENIAQMKAGEIVIWDNIFAKGSEIKKSELDTFPGLANIGDYRTTEDNREMSFSVYAKK